MTMPEDRKIYMSILDPDYAVGTRRLVIFMTLAEAKNMRTLLDAKIAEETKGLFHTRMESGK